MNLNLQCGISYRSYGIVGAGLLASLVKQGNSVCLFPLGGGVEMTSELEPIFKEAVNNQRHLDKSAPSIRIWHEWDVCSHPNKGTQVAFPFFELDSLPDEYPKMSRTQLKNHDKIIVASKWAKEIVESEIPNHPPVAVVPLGIDPEIFYPATTPNSGPYTFLMSGKFEKRKSHDIICQAFSSAFSPRDDVRLQLLCHNPFLGDKGNQDWYNYFLSSPMGSKVQILPWQTSQTEVAEIMRNADCGLFPSRAEGFNLPLLEMMAVGRSVISTRATAHTQFCTNLNSLLVEPEGLEDAFDGIWFDGKSGRWLTWTNNMVDNLVELMRMAYRNNMRTNEAGVMSGQKYNWNNSAARLMEAIQ